MRGYLNFGNYIKFVFLELASGLSHRSLWLALIANLNINLRTSQVVMMRVVVVVVTMLVMMVMPMMMVVGMF